MRTNRAFPVGLGILLAIARPPALIFSSLAAGAAACIAERAAPDRFAHAISVAAGGRLFLCKQVHFTYCDVPWGLPCQLPYGLPCFSTRPFQCLRIKAVS